MDFLKSTLKTTKLYINVISCIFRAFRNAGFGDFPGGPVVKTLCFHCKGHGFDPRLGN